MTPPAPSVAVIGMACRFPGASTVDEFWHNLERGVESIRFFSDRELLAAGVDPVLVARADYVKAKGVLDGAEMFDASFFDVGAREAALMDPQHRIFLECARDAFDDGGYDPVTFAGLTGVFGGAGVNSYLLMHLARHKELLNPIDSFQTSIHNKADHLTTRVAYKLNLRGPAVTIQTACSTSLVAVATACQSLVDYQCDLALAGGVTIAVPQISGYVYQAGGTASPDGHCRSFDARAAGTVDGSGAGIVLLKRLDDALADGDSVYAVITGWAVNNDGAQKPGYTAPGLDRQAEVIAAAQAIACAEPDSIGYIEAHGTGTRLGDPIEIAALTQAFRLGTTRKRFCAIGSVKSNIGHLDAAAGVAGLIKTVLAVHHGNIPPSLHFETPNPLIDFDATPFEVNARLRAWPGASSPRRAGVSSFGIGGTNAHVIVEEAPTCIAERSRCPWQLLVLSAKSPPALEMLSERLAAHLAEQPDIDLADVAFTLQAGRQAFNYRRAVLAEGRADAIRSLRELSPDSVESSTQAPARRPVFFMFPGQGAQYTRMAASVYDTEPVFREHVDTAATLLRPALGLDLRDVLYPPDGGGADRRLDQTMYAQPALFVVSYALARLWMHWGVRPDALIGHSVGEYVAACLAGVLSLEDALALVAARGRLIQALPAGAMLAVPLPEDELRPFLGSDLDLAAINGPALCTVSGPDRAIAACHEALAKSGVACRRLQTSHAFHSRMMEPAVEMLARLAGGFRVQAPGIPYISNVTGDWVSSAPDAASWGRHLREPVRFAQGIQTLMVEQSAVLLEVGPGRTLKTLTRWNPAKRPGHIVESSLSHRDRADADVPSLLMTLGRLWLAGVAVDWTAYHSPSRRRRVHLPTYPFERRRYSIHDGELRRERKPDLADWFYTPLWSETSRTPSRRLTGTGPWLVFRDRQGVGEELCRQLDARHEDVVVVVPGHDFVEATADSGERVFEIHPARPDHYEQLFARLDRCPRSIVHLWNLGVPDVGTDPLDRSFHALIYLAQALGKRDLGLTEITVVSDGLHAVTGAERVYPEKAALLGPCRVIGREDDRITCYSVDFAQEPSDSASGCDAQLLEELCRSAREPTVAYRHGRRWAQRYRPTRIDPPAGIPPRLRHRGVYVVSGGMGGIGLEIAAELAARVSARLVLFGRTAHPKRVQRLRALGAEVMIVEADVTNDEDVRRLGVRARERFGAINGIIHAAGVPGGRLIARMTAEAASRTLAPKIAGARVLASVFGDSPLDFLVLCGSLGSVVGRPGQVAYCAANAVLDSFAEAHASATGTFTLSIAWGEWEGVGMAAAARGRLERRDEAAFDGHPFVDSHGVLPSGQHVFTTRFDVRRHWVVDEHRLRGHAVVPGVGFVEMVRAALADVADGRVLELRDLLFIAPLRVPDIGVREVRVLITAGGDERRFSIESDETGPGSQTIARQYCTGNAAWVPCEPRAHDLNALLVRLPLREEILPDADREEDLGPRWQNVKRAWVDGDEVLTRLELGSEFAADCDQIHFHPALIDRAMGRAQEYLVSGLYLPVAYQRLRLHAPVPPKVFSWARYRSTGEAEPETLTFDTVVFDEHGRVVVEAEGFTQKRIHNAAAAMRSLAGQAPVAASVRESPGRGIRAVEGGDAFVRLLAGATRSQVAVSVCDIEAEITQTNTVTREDALAVMTSITPTAMRHARPELATTYAAPESPSEQLVTQAWEETLGIEPVGRDDNFFMLGGDSVQAIQIIARLNDRGIHVTPQQFFQHQTVKELAASLAGAFDAALPEPVAANDRAVEPFSLLTLPGDDRAMLAGLITESDRAAAPVDRPEPRRAGMSYSLFYFADDQEEPRPRKYDLCLEGARFADQNGFTAIWTPERHFHPKGGLYPNPSVLTAALAAITDRLHLRAGSLVLPLHHALRVAEDWSILDNLSNGRVGVSFTSGWMPNDFAFFPERYRDKREEMFKAIQQVLALWRGEVLEVADGTGRPIAVRTFPRPIQRELPVWLTCSGDPEMFVRAGELGFHVLTALLTQTLDEAAEKIALYRASRARAGHNAASGCVTMMLHTFVASDEARAHATSRGPLINYLKSHAGLIATGAESLGIRDPTEVQRHIDDLAAFAFERYYQTGSLIGTPERCLGMVRRLEEIGVDEVACLIDFGIDAGDVIAALPLLCRLKELSAPSAAGARAGHVAR